MSPRLVDMAGQRFGRWLVVRYFGPDKSRRGAVWECRCDCGNNQAVKPGV